jgi:hypothetical protein
VHRGRRRPSKLPSFVLRWVIRSRARKACTCAQKLLPLLTDKADLPAKKSSARAVRPVLRRQRRAMRRSACKLYRNAINASCPELSSNAPAQTGAKFSKRPVLSDRSFVFVGYICRGLGAASPAFGKPASHAARSSIVMTVRRPTFLAMSRLLRISRFKSVQPMPATFAASPGDIPRRRSRSISGPRVRPRRLRISRDPSGPGWQV